MLCAASKRLPAYRIQVVYTVYYVHVQYMYIVHRTSYIVFVHRIRT